MFLKTIALALPVMLGGMYVSGAFGGGEWSRDVGRPPEQVMAALEDLDIRDQPGSPGTDPSRSGGVPSMFRLTRTATAMRWTVMSGDRVATTMIADFTPAPGGGTHVVAHVERGDAPDDFVAPAFRSTGLTLGLFSMALEGEINKLTKPALADQGACDQLEERFTETNLAASANHRSHDLREAVGATATTVMRLGAYDAERRRLGCSDPGNDGPFRPVSDTMGRGDAAPADDAPVGPRPGEPMLDPTPAGDRRP